MNSSIGPFLVIGAGIVLGILLRAWKRFPPEAPRVLNAYVIAVALPTLVLSQLPKFLYTLGSGAPQSGGGSVWVLIILALIPWLVFGVAILFFGVLYRMGKITKGQWGLLALSGGLGNTSFVGIPLIEALLGKEQIPRAILLDQLGTFLALSVAGTMWISYLKSSEAGAFRATRFLKAVFQFPPFLAILASFVYARFGVFEAEGSFSPGVQSAIQSALERFAQTLVPVAMVSVGSQLKLSFGEIRRESKGIAWGLGYKMALAPLMIWILTSALLRNHPEALKLGVLEAAMAPMITATVLGMEEGFAPKLGALMLGIGIPLSLFTVPLWSRVLSL